MTIIDPIEFAKEIMSCSSVTPENAGSLEVMEKALKPMGFEYHRMVFTEEGTGDVDNLYARRGKGGKNLCFAGHVDVVDPGDIADWKVNPFEPQIIDGKLYGRGAVDMKGAIACWVAAVSEFLEENPDSDKSLSFLITGDEEGPAINGTIKMLDWLEERNEKLDDCIVGEPTNPTKFGEMIKIGRRGSVNFYLTIHGTQGHVAYPQLAENPISIMVNLLHRLDHHLLDNGNDHFDPSNLEITTIDVDNGTENLIPAKIYARFNIRFNDEYSSKQLIEMAEKFLSEEIGKGKSATYDLRTRVSGESFITKPGHLSDVVAGGVEDIHGEMPELSTTGGTSDARFIKNVCPVVECGLVNATAHKVDEHIAVEDVYLLTKAYKKMIERYFA